MNPERSANNTVADSMSSAISVSPFFSLLIILNGKIFFSKALELDDLFVEAYYQYGLACQRLGNYDEAESTLLKGQEIAERKNNIQGLAYIYKGFTILYSAWGKW